MILRWSGVGGQGSVARLLITDIILFRTSTNIYRFRAGIAQKIINREPCIIKPISFNRVSNRSAAGGSSRLRFFQGGVLETEFRAKTFPGPASGRAQRGSGIWLPVSGVMSTNWNHPGPQNLVPGPLLRINEKSKRGGDEPKSMKVSVVC